VKVAIIANGKLINRKRLDRQRTRLQRALPDAEITAARSGRPGHAIDMAAEHCRDSDVLVAAGGDGTLNEILNGCMQAQAQEPAVELPVFGVLACGSANDFARAVGLAGTVEELAGLLRSGVSRRIDVGRLRCHDPQGEALERYFFNVADAGIGAEVVQRLGSVSGYLGSNLRYLRAIVAAFREHRQMELVLSSDAGLDWSGRSLAVVAANGCYFGSGLGVAPGARIDDGQLFVTVVGDASFRDFLANLGKLKRGVPLNHPEITYHSARSLTVAAAGGRAALEADGEFVGYTPAVFEVLPGAARLLAP
jgi:YegS/Rv2252/BmrU family lipid kinase